MDKFLLLLTEALDSEHGIKVEAASVDSLRQKLYRTRKEARDNGDERFEGLTLTVSPNSRDELWIMKRI